MSLVGNVKVQDCKVRKSWSKMTYGPLKQSGGGNLVHKSAARGDIGKIPPMHVFSYEDQCWNFVKKYNFTDNSLFLSKSMSGSCHLDRASNVESSVECLF